MSYADLQNHASMVFDDTRNRAYRDAMAAVITPESVVLDLGAGVGVLGLLAAKLGARKVYCVEPSPVVAHIPTLAMANGVADRVVALRGRIEDIVLPEQVDLILSVFTGNLLFTEGLLPSLYHARDRWLKPGGAMIPDRARLRLAAVEADESYGRLVAGFRKPHLGLDYSALATPAANACRAVTRGKSAMALLTPAATAAELDLRTTLDSGTRWQGALETTRAGVLHGLLGWIEIGLGATWLSTAADAPEVHWQPVLLPLESPVEVARGQACEASLRFIDDAQVYWSVTVEGVRQRQSTVLGNADIAIDLMLSSPDCVDPLGEDGVLLEQVLAGMRAGKSNQAIAADLLAAWPARFADAHAALKHVGAWAARFRAHPSRKA